MFAKILSIAREKLSKISSNQDQSRNEDVIDDPIVEFVIQVDAKGDFAIGADCFSTEETHAAFLGMTLYLLNAGMLSEYFVESLRLCSEGDKEKIEFVMDAMTCWKEIYDKEISADHDVNRDAVDPRDVFSFHKMRP